MRLIVSYIESQCNGNFNFYNYFNLSQHSTPVRGSKSGSKSGSKRGSKRGFKRESKRGSIGDPKKFMVQKRITIVG